MESKNELESIENQIGETQNRIDEVIKEIRKLKLRLGAKRKEQGATIADRGNAEELGKEIVSLQTEINGLDEARLQLLETSRILQSDKASLLRTIARDQAEMKKSDILQIEEDIYGLLVKAANRLPELHKTRVDYVAQLVVAAGSTEARDQGHKITLLHETLRRELPNLLDCFPRSVRENGNLPNPNRVRGAIKRS